jgi:hypothetical protein
LDTSTNVIDQVREQAQALYKQIEENSLTNHEAIRGDLTALAANLKKLAKDQRNDAKTHLENAASLVQASPKDGTEMRERMRETLQNISQAVAATRSNVKQRV